MSNNKLRTQQTAEYQMGNSKRNPVVLFNNAAYSSNKIFLLNSPPLHIFILQYAAPKVFAPLTEYYRFLETQTRGNGAEKT
jgi:hypothetical protein